MIRYDLNCDSGHRFDAWFRDSEAYDDQARTGLLSCPHCGGARVSKAPMAPSVPRERSVATAEGSPELASGMPAEVRSALRDIRRRMLAGSEDVGGRFADEALRMHRGEVPHRSVRGSATPHEVRELLQEGVPISPIPPDPGGH